MDNATSAALSDRKSAKKLVDSGGNKALNAKVLETLQTALNTAVGHANDHQNQVKAQIVLMLANGDYHLLGQNPHKAFTEAREGKLAANHQANQLARLEMQTTETYAGDPLSVPHTPSHLAEYASTMMGYATRAITMMAKVKQKQLTDRAVDPESLITLQKYEDLRKARPEQFPWMVADVTVPSKNRLHPDDYNDGRLLLCKLVVMENDYYNIKDLSSVLKDRVSHAAAVWGVYTALLRDESSRLQARGERSSSTQYLENRLLAAENSVMMPSLQRPA